MSDTVKTLKKKATRKPRQPKVKPDSKSTAFTETSNNANQNYAQFIFNGQGKIEHVVLHVDDWERLAKLDPVYQAKNKLEGLQLNVILPETRKMVRIPHAVAVMVVRHGQNLLKAWRLYRGYKQSDFSEHGIAQPTMFQMEQSTKNRIGTLESLSDIYGCDIEQLSSYVINEKETETSDAK
ncbi:MAG: hypothetical protein VYA60_07705 [Pseudomonadota bacterium]|nr:hypothetical protein [Pseudomonadota bacterium]